MGRPRLLLVPDVTQLEWGIRPQLEEWAEVASFDAPGVGGEPAPEVYGVEAIARRALEEVDRRGWERFVVVGDGYGNGAAVRVGVRRRPRVAGVALGHACLSMTSRGDRPGRTPGIYEAFVQLARTDYRSFARGLTQITTGSFDDEMVEAFTERVPRDAAVAYLEAVLDEGEHEVLEDRLRQLGAPLLFACHLGCVQWTEEGYRDAVAAFPTAAACGVELKPSVSPEFADELRRFCLPLFAESPATGPG